MTIGEDRPSLSDFPRVIPQHQCWRNGGVECRACELEEQAGEAALNAERCDSCDAEGFRLTFSPDHCAHFCDGCYAREDGHTSWVRPVGGQGSWEPTPAHRESVTDLLVAFLACLLGGVLLLGLVVAGRSVMCRVHDGALSYCNSSMDVSDGGER